MMKAVLKKLTPITFICLAILLGVGCIEFEKQTLVYRHDPESDTLIIWQQYEGVYGDSRKDTLSRKELEELDSVILGQRTFFFANWLFEYNGKEVNDFLGSGQRMLEEKRNENEIKVLRKSLALAKLLKKSIKIKNGPFYQNKEGKLSATQEVTIKNISGIIRQANALIRVKVQSDLEAGEFDKDDPQYAPLLERSLEKGMNFVTLNGQHLRFTWPMTKPMFDQEFKKDKELFIIREQLNKSGGMLVHKDQMLVFEIGAEKKAEVELSLVLPDNKYRNNALADVKAAYGLKKDFAPHAARSKFFKQLEQR